MLNIVICDEDVRTLEFIHKQVKSYLDQHAFLKFNIQCLESIDELSKIDIEKADMILMELLSSSSKEVDITKSLRRISSKFVLIFISSFIQHAIKGYEVNAFRFLLKDSVSTLLTEALEDALKVIDLNRKQVSFKFTGYDRPIQLFTSNILYIESDLHCVKFHLSNSEEIFKVYDKLNNVEKQLPKDEFIRIHQSYMVNYKYFKEAKNYQAIIEKETFLPISKRFFPTVKDKLISYKEKENMLV